MNSADHEVLWLSFALRNDLITIDDAVTVAKRWATDKSRTIAEIFEEHDTLDSSICTAVSGLVQYHLSLREGDANRTLNETLHASSLPTELFEVDDPDVQRTMTSFRDAKADAVNPADWPSGSQDRYEILRKHAAGGLGQVFLARDREIHRNVALKEIRPRHAHSTSVRRRFMREAQITGSLEHPSIVPVYSLGAHQDGRPFYAMQFIHGRTLDEVVKQQFKSGGGASVGERSFELRRLLSYFTAVCNAMEYAHQRGVVHRDLKPGNVLIGRFGEALVVDWGLAKVVDREEDSACDPRNSDSVSDRDLTAAGSTMGTPAFMSPEQAAGRNEDVGPASDIYSLGGILYVLLTGQTAFTAGTVEAILGKVRSADFPHPREVDRRVPRALEAVCLKAMALRPDHRYASCRELADDVERWLADEPVHAYSESLKDRIDRAVTRSRFGTEFGEWGSLLLGVAVVVAVTHLTLFFLSLGEPPYPWNWLVRCVQVAGIGGLLWWYRSFSLRPTTDGERFLWVVWSTYLVGWVLVHGAAKLLHDAQSWNELALYPIWSVLTGIVFFAMGAVFWGRFYFFGIAFFSLAALLPYQIKWSPLAFGSLMAVCLILIRRHLLVQYRQPVSDSSTGEVTI